MDNAVKQTSKHEAILNEETLKDTIEDLRELIEQKLDSFILNILINLHSADIAEVLHYLSTDERRYIFSLLPKDVASEVLTELEGPFIDELLENLNPKQISEVLTEMDSDDAADIISELPEQLAENVLSKINKEDREEVRELLTHHSETAGGLMAKEFVAVNQENTVDEAIQEIRKKAEEVEDIYNVYAVDDNDRLVGEIPLKKLILARPGARVKDVMDTEVISVHTGMDQEEVARIVKKYDLVSVPVVDSEGRLTGRITIDDVVDVIEDEASEDMTMMAGITETDIPETSLFKVSRARLPWLLVAFGGEIISGYLMSRFQASIAQLLSVVFFVPLIMAVGGNVGNQAAVVVIRGLATGEIALADTRRRLFHEFFVAFINGLFLATLIFSISSLWLKNSKQGFVIGLSLIIIVENAAFMGAVIPFILKKLGIDPAVATSPFITTSNDIFGLFIYFSLITLFLKFF
ncbi:magnesium transporter MgtE [bacterium BMS3Abin05]|nr:magnesium transporter MgtE [bacterium BMS3Abin05]GBE28443.1 magnesium transporter MgtE [bacterium BMS3Bbin03]HDK35507.1 magnesium transporter [Bacteroidota bacterium]HDZ11955.1 magnesium transporter [Bacteroidota bacterium]